MKLPKQVQDQIDLAEQLEKQGYGQQAETPPLESTVPAPEATQVPAIPPAEEKPVEKKPEVPAPSEEELLKPEPMPEPIKDDEDLRARLELEISKNRSAVGRLNRLQGEHATLQRKYNEVKDLAPKPENEEIAGLKNQIAQLSSQLAESRITTTPVAPADISQAPSEPAHIAKIRSEHGEELANQFLKQWEENQQLKNDVGQVKNTVSDIQTQTKEQAEYDRKLSDLTVKLSSMGLNLHQMNNDPGFVNWLSYSDPMLGKSYQQLLNDHIKDGNIESAMQFFLTYSQSQQQQVTHAPQTPAPALEQHVTKPTAAPASDTVDQTPFYSFAEIDQRYREFNKQIIAARTMGDIKEAERLELELRKFEASVVDQNRS